MRQGVRLVSTPASSRFTSNYYKRENTDQGQQTLRTSTSTMGATRPSPTKAIQHLPLSNRRSSSQHRPNLQRTHTTQTRRLRILLRRRGPALRRRRTLGRRLPRLRRAPQRPDPGRHATRQHHRPARRLPSHARRAANLPTAYEPPLPPPDLHGRGR